MKRSLASGPVTVLVLFCAAFAIAITACRPATPAPAEHAIGSASGQVLFVTPVQGEIGEGEAGAWIGDAIFDAGSDGRPSLVSWTFGEGPSATLCQDPPGGGGASCMHDFCDPAPFNGGSTYSTFSNSQSLAVADFDGDGLADVAVGEGGTVDVFHANGAGLASPVSYPVDYSSSMVAADLNGDGRPDLVVGNRFGTDVQLLRNDGAGGFFPPVTFNGFASGPQSLAIGDFNGDGFPDLAASLVSGGTIHVMLGNGAGGFSSSFDVPTAGSGAGLVAADVDMNGFDDLLYENFGLYVLLWNGSGFTSLPVQQPADSSLAVGDLNEDGIPDLVAGRFGAIDELFGNGTGMFTPGPQISFDSATSVLALGDVDGDGHLDLANADLFAPGSSIRLGFGDGSWSKPESDGLGGTGFTGLAFGDSTGDGRRELFATNFNTGILSFELAQRLSWDCPVTASHVYTDSKGTGTGPFYDFPVKLTVQSALRSDSYDSTIRVDDRPPTNGGVQPATTVLAEGDPLVGYVDWCDPGTNDLVTASVDWGDGSSASPSGGISPGCATTSKIPVTHVYPNGGSYVVQNTLADDEGMASLPASVSVTVLDLAPQITTVTTNGPVPVGQAATVWVALARPQGDVYTYDYDWDGNGLFTDPGDVQGATANSASFTASSVGTRTVHVRVHDDDGNAVNGAVDVTWTASTSNNAPIAAADAVSTTEDTLLTIPFGTLLANDSDPDAGDAISFVSAGQPSHGVIGLGVGNLNYIPEANFYGKDSFVYVIHDAAGATAAAIVTVTVTPLNDPPVANPDVIVTAEDVPKTVTAASLMANDLDVDSATISITTVGAAVNGTVAISAGMVTFTPNAGFHGDGSFNYTLTDGTATATGAVTVNVLPVNHVPGAPVTLSPTGGAVVSSATPQLSAAGATDPDGDVLSYRFQVDTVPTFDGASMQDSGVVQGSTWTPAVLSEDTLWYWRARASDGAASSDWTMGSFFVDVTNEGPTTPLPLDPIGGSIVDSQTVTLTALDSTDPDPASVISYVFTIYSDVALSSVVETSPAVAQAPQRTTWTPSTELKAGTRYWWTVEAVDGAGAHSAPSAAETFRTLGGGGGGGGGCSVDGSTPGAAGMLASLGMVALALAVRRRRKA